MGNLHYYRNEQDFVNVYNGSGYTEPWVSCVLESENSRFNKSKLWDGVSSVLDLRGVENNPNLETKIPTGNWVDQGDSVPGWVTYDEADKIDKYYFKKLKSFVLAGITGDTPIIQTILTDWDDGFGQTGDTGTARFEHTNNDYCTIYNWGGSSYDYGPYNFEIYHGSGNIWATVID